MIDRTRRIPGLDGIRGFAILAVVLYHSKFINGGFLGVDVFFVLSGYLITSLLLNEYQATNGIALGHFYWRRAIRLGPALLVLLIGACLFETLYRPSQGVDSIFLRSFYALTYFSNWYWALSPTENPMGALGATWSLAIEEQFYILWPVVLLQMLKLRVPYPYIAAALLASVGSAVLWRYLLWDSGAHFLRIYAGTDSHADPILIGCFLAVVAVSAPQRFWTVVRPWLAATAPFSIAGLTAMMLFLSFRDFRVFQITSVALLTGLLILNVTVAPSTIARGVLEFTPLVWLGRISYGVYLWHSVATMYIREHALLDSRLAWIALGLALATASYYLIEQPCLRNFSPRPRDSSGLCSESSRADVSGG